MIYDANDGFRGKVFAKGQELDLAIIRVNTETGEVLHAPRPFVLDGDEVVTETLVFENLTVEPL